MTAPRMPTALTITDVESAAGDAHHIAAMAEIAMNTESFPHGSNTAAILYVIRDLSEILAWNLDRLHIEQRGKP